MIVARFLLPAAIKVLLHDFQQQLIDVFGRLTLCNQLISKLQQSMLGKPELFQIYVLSTT